MLSVINTLIRLNLTSSAIYLADVFVRNGGDLNRRDFFGRTVTESILMGDHAHFLRALIKLGWKPSGKLFHGMGALSLAIALRKNAIFHALVKMRANLHKRNLDGSTPLMIAAQYGDIQKLHALLRMGANPNDQDSRGWTAAHRAMFYRPKGLKTVVKTLLDAGLDRSLQDYTGRDFQMKKLKKAA